MLEEENLDPNTVRTMMKKIIPKSLNARPYILRSYFDFNLQLANIPNRWQSFFMGHKGDIEAIYTRKHLPEELIQQEKYSYKQNRN